MVFSGHGLQPYWTVEDGQLTEAFTTADAASLMARFGRLVALVAEQHHAELDNVFDLARVLRAPGSVNHKNDPVPVTARRDTGGPLTVAEIDERLTELGIDAQPDDTTSSEPLSNPDGWLFAWQTCPYVAKLVDAIPTDGPKPGGGRNPWVCSQAVRLHCAWMLGCITEDDYGRAAKLLEQRLTGLLASTEPRRRIRRFEMRDAFRLGRKRAACKTEDQARAELGGHTHTPPEPPPDVDDHHAGEYHDDRERGEPPRRASRPHGNPSTWVHGCAAKSNSHNRASDMHRSDGLQSSTPAANTLSSVKPRAAKHGWHWPASPPNYPRPSRRLHPLRGGRPRQHHRTPTDTRR